MSTGLPADFSQFQDFVLHELNSSGGADSLEDAVELFRGFQRQTDSREHSDETADFSNGSREAANRSVFRQLREKYIAGGGKLMTIEEIEQSIR